MLFMAKCQEILFDKKIDCKIMEFFNFTQMKNLVFISLNQVGDNVLSLLSVRSLCQYYPELSLHICNKGSFVPKSTLQMFGALPNIKTVQGFNKHWYNVQMYKDAYRLYNKIKDLLTEGDVVISSLLGLSSFAIAMTPFLLLLKLQYGKAFKVGQIFPRWFNYDGHLVDFHAEVFSALLNKDIKYIEHDEPIGVKKTVEPRTLAIIPGASRLFKALSPKTFAKIINHFASKGYVVKILGSNSKVDTTQANKIMDLVGTNAQNLTGKTTLNEYIQIIANSSYVVANDSSGQHIAHICKTPVAVMWGRNKETQIPKSYAWQGKLAINLYNESYKYCRKCSFLNKFKTRKRILRYHKNCKACITQNLDLITPENIILQIENHIERLSM